MQGKVLAMLAVLTLAACAGGPVSDEARMVKLADDLNARGDAESAATLYERAAATSKDTVGAYTRLGNSLLDAGQPERAAAAFRTALNADADHGEALLGLGTAQLRADQTESAVRTLAAAAPKVQTSAAYNRLGTAMILTGNAAQAEDAFRNAAEIEPMNLDTQSNIALAEAIGGKGPASIETARAITTSVRAEQRHFRNLMLVMVLARQDAQAAAIHIPDYPEAEKRAFLSEARKIRAIASPAGKARAIGLLG